MAAVTRGTDADDGGGRARGKKTNGELIIRITERAGELRRRRRTKLGQGRTGRDDSSFHRALIGRAGTLSRMKLGDKLRKKEKVRNIRGLT